MKKRWIVILAAAALFVSLCSCAAPNRAPRRTAADPAPPAAPKQSGETTPAHRAAPRHRSAHRPAPPRTAAPRAHPMPAMPMTPGHPYGGQDGFRTNQDGFRQHDGFGGHTDNNNNNNGYRGATTRDGYRDSRATRGMNRDGYRDGVAGGTVRSGGGGTTAPRTAAPRFRAAPPVRSVPRANRIPATRIPLR
ncbi:MAG: hypothetical protein FWG72_06815 [Oscillospiraceae bacterium]|nr:hypothetical protein [Oscillospiraceae bacterium]